MQKAVLFVLAGACLTNAAPPTLTLTPEGTAAGYAITTFADNFPAGSPYGPRGIAFPDGGGVLVTHRDGSVRRFLNVDGQRADAVPVARNYGSGNAGALAKVGGKIYLAQPVNGQLTQVNDDGTIFLPAVSGLSNVTAIAAGTSGSRLVASSPEIGLIVEIEVPTKFVTDLKQISTPALAVSNDGRIFYAIFSNQVIGYRTSDGAQAFFGGTLSNVSGMTVGIGPTANFLFVNTSDGRVIRISQESGVQTTIATGGSRGDFMATAPDGSIFVTQADHILRIAPRNVAPPPSFSLSSTSAAFASTVSTGSVNIIASSASADWTASSNVPWVSVGPSSGRGNGTVTYTVGANPTASQRVAILTIAGISFTISQAGASGPANPVFSLSSTSATIAAGGGGGAVALTASISSASWTASSNAAWAAVSPSSGNGSGTVSYAVAANTANSQRVATLTIAGLAFTVTQSGTTVPSEPPIPLRLTAQGVAAGLTITSFVRGFSVLEGIGPLGIAFPESGGVLISSLDGTVRRMPSNADGQIASATDGEIRNYGGGNAVGMTKVNGKIYLAQRADRRIVELNDDGSVNQIVATGLPNVTALTSNSANGHIYASSISGGALWDIDPASKRVNVFKQLIGDGLAVSPDNTVLYAETGGRIVGFRIADGLQVFDSGFINGADGCAIGSGSLAGFLFVNTTDGRLVRVNLANSQQTVIANSGSRGDFVSVDPADGSLLVTQADRILRVSLSGGGGFGGASPFSLSSTSLNAGSAAGTGSIDLSSSLPTAAWTAASLSPWLTITSGSSGTGSGRVSFSFSANSGESSRTGTLAIGGLFATVTQDRGSEPNIPLKLSADALASGLSLSTFIDRFPSNSRGVGPLGIAFPDTGGVFVTHIDGLIYRFPDNRDGQHADEFRPIRNYGHANALGLTKFEGRLYMAQTPSNRVVGIDDTGAIPFVIMNGLFEAIGVAPDPVNRRVWASGTSLLAYWDIVTGDAIAFAPYGADGITVSPDGKMLYAANNDRILGFTIPRAELTFNSGEIPGADGCAIGTGVFAGKLFVNATDGRLWQVDLTTGEKVVLASGGSRGDFVTPDPNDGSLLITQSDRILRLRASGGGAFGGISFVLSETSAEVTAGGGTGTVSITASAAAAPWIAISNTAWIRIVDGSSGTGSGAVTYAVDANPTSAARTGTLTIAGNTFTITQQQGVAP
jgi:hypothetical protein